MNVHEWYFGAGGNGRASLSEYRNGIPVTPESRALINKYQHRTEAYVKGKDLEPIGAGGNGLGNIGIYNKGLTPSAQNQKYIRTFQNRSQNYQR